MNLRPIAEAPDDIEVLFDQSSNMMIIEHAIVID
jgi:hypothetical protein